MDGEWLWQPRGSARLITEGGNITPPGLWLASGSQANQWKSFKKVVVKPKGFTLLELEFEEDEEIRFVHHDEEGLEVSVWCALPVHQKVADFFMPGLEMSKSMKMYKGLYSAVGEENHHLLDGLCEFIWAAMTATEAQAVSALDKKWVHFDHHASDEVVGWYKKAVARFVCHPRWTGSADATRPAAPWGEHSHNAPWGEHCGSRCSSLPPEGDKEMCVHASQARPHLLPCVYRPCGGGRQYCIPLKNKQ